MSDKKNEVILKEYFPPKIIHTEKLECRASVCARADETECGAGPIQS